MKISSIYPYLRFFLLLAGAAGAYFFWEKGGAPALLQALHPPAAVSPIRLGSPAPDFSVPADRIASRTEFRFSSLRGFPVVMHFWATWCAPCLQELPLLLELAERWRPQGYTFVAVAIDSSWTVLDDFFLKYPKLAKMRNLMVLVLDPEGKIAESYASTKFPETFLIQDNLTIDNKFVGPQPWDNPRMETYLRNLRTTPHTGDSQ